MPTVPVTSRIKPAALQAGDTVGIVAPASNIKRELLEAGCDRLRKMGFRPFFFDSILEQDLYFAGPVERRVAELEEMFVRPEVKAIVCARGGYGCNYLIDRLDLRKITAHPKIFVGYSDATTLLTWFADAAGFVTFHGPMVTRDFAQPDGVDASSWEEALTGASRWTLETAGVEPLREGSADGILYGGCLSMLVASLGTPHEIRTAGTVLFVEDVAAKPYQIDRMLMHLKHAGKLAGVKGVVFGEMLECHQAASQGYTLQEVILRVLADLDIPIAYGLSSGHVSKRNITLPIGVKVSLQVESAGVRLQILEPATTRAAMNARRS